jgi:hypothetical protein
MNNNTLEALLITLARRYPEALEIWAAAEREEDDEFEPDDDVMPWLSLEEANQGWECGYRIQPDEASEWTLVASGTTPLLAAQALLAKIEAPPAKN